MSFYFSGPKTTTWPLRNLDWKSRWNVWKMIFSKLSPEGHRSSTTTFTESCSSAAAAAQFTCDDVDVGIRVFTQLHGVAVPLERLPKLLLHRRRPTQTVEAHNLHTHTQTHTNRSDKHGWLSSQTVDRGADIFTASSITFCSGAQTTCWRGAKRTWTEKHKTPVGCLSSKRLLIWTNESASLRSSSSSFCWYLPSSGLKKR